MEALEKFAAEFVVAVDAEDWVLVAELQSRLQTVVADASTGIQTESEQQRFTALLQQIKAQLDRAVALAAAAKEAAAQDLRQLQQTKNAASAYSHHSQKP